VNGLSQAWVVLSPPAGLAVSAAVHALLAHALRGKRIVVTLAGSAGAGLVATGALTLLGERGPGGTTWEALPSLCLNLTSYLALVYVYIAFVNAHVSSLRVRILHELHHAPEGLGAEELLRHYNAREIVNRRVARLVGGNQLRQRGGRLFMRPSDVVVIARLIALCRRALFGRERRV
jgi:hypothetical protein